MTSYEESEPEIEPESRRGWSPGAVALIATVLLLLGLGGAFFGIYVADSTVPASKATVGPTGLPIGTSGQTEPTEPVTSSAPPSPSSSPSSSPEATSPSPQVGTFALPVVTGMDFQAARTSLRALKLGVNVVFQAVTPDDYLVTATNPAAGATVGRGTTVTLVVPGSAPEVVVPSVLGRTCATAAALLVDRGLFPAYPNGRRGVVTGQDPPAPSPEPVYWNQTVKIWCGGDGTPVDPTA